MTNNVINKSLLESFSYEAYLELIKNLVVRKMTTGTEQDEQRIQHTKLNASRMRRIDNTIEIPKNALQPFLDIPEKQIWVVLLESWCADGAQTIPILNKIAKATPMIDLTIVLRDEHPELMNLFLTNGTQSIPKLIITDTKGNLLTTWGPRSKVATQLVNDYKKKHGKIDEHFKEALQRWYNKDRGKEILNDLVEVIGKCRPSEHVAK